MSSYLTCYSYQARQGKLLTISTVRAETLA